MALFELASICPGNTIDVPLWPVALGGALMFGAILLLRERKRDRGTSPRLGNTK